MNKFLYLAVTLLVVSCGGGGGNSGPNVVSSQSSSSSSSSSTDPPWMSGPLSDQFINEAAPGGSHFLSKLAKPLAEWEETDLLSTAGKLWLRHQHEILERESIFKNFKFI